MADRFTEILTNQRLDWTRSVELMQAGQLIMHEDGRDVTEDWKVDLLGKIAEIEELLDRHDARNA